MLDLNNQEIFQQSKMHSFSSNHFIFKQKQETNKVKTLERKMG